jgi:hypothetical protein
MDVRVLGTRRLGDTHAGRVHTDARRIHTYAGRIHTHAHTVGGMWERCL